MKPTDCIFFQITKASQNAIRFFSQRVTPLGVTAVQALVLLFLFDEDSVTSKDLGERAQLDSATLTGIIDRLEGQGLVVRGEHPDDRRAISVRLTDAGRETAAKVAALSEEANRDFLRGLSPEENQALRRLLSVVREVG
jgi:MarR family transcriptional regulator, organic hydroperoxide resistance regulator